MEKITPQELSERSNLSIKDCEIILDRKKRKRDVFFCRRCGDLVVHDVNRGSSTVHMECWSCMEDYD